MKKPHKEKMETWSTRIMHAHFSCIISNIRRCIIWKRKHKNRKLRTCLRRASQELGTSIDQKLKKDQKSNVVLFFDGITANVDAIWGCLAMKTGRLLPRTDDLQMLAFSFFLIYFLSIVVFFYQQREKKNKIKIRLLAL